jgi:beta-propeller repeat-containing protein/beta-propeller uncharacterized protein DUF5122
MSSYRLAFLLSKRVSGLTLTLACLLLLSVFLPSSVKRVSAAPSGVFMQRTWGGNSTDEGRGVWVDQSGNIYVTGKTTSFGATNGSVFVLKYDSTGDLQWQKTWGGTGLDIGEDIIGDASGNIYVAGGTYSYGTGGNGDALLLKLAPNGTLLWQRTWGGSHQDWANRITIDSSGNLYLAGFTFSFGPEAPIYPSALLLKYSSNGTLLMQRVLGGNPPDDLGGVAVDQSGNIYVGGYYYFSGWASRYILIAKLNSTGDQIWAKVWGPPGEVVATRLILDQSGDLIVGGYSNSVGQGSQDAVLLKVDPAGNLLWQRTWGGKGDDIAFALVVDHQGDSFITGRTWSFAPYPEQVFLTEFNSNGNLLGQYEWGGGYDDGRALALDSQGRIFVTGIVNEPPPYRLSPLPGVLGIPNYNLSSVSLLANRTRIAANSTGPSLNNPEGLVTYAGGSDSFIFGFAVPRPSTVSFSTNLGVGLITFNGTTYANGQAAFYPNGGYEVAAITPYGYGFIGWIATGNITVSSNSSNPTIALVGGSGTLIARFTPLSAITLLPLTITVIFISTLVMLTLRRRHKIAKSTQLS